MKTGIELIAAERKEQIEKHGRTIAADIIENKYRELSVGAQALLMPIPITDDFPDHWNRELVAKMASKSYKERLIISGALIAAEIDRIQNCQS